MAITQVPIRAEVTLGGLVISTPYITSFNVHRRRGSPATFDVSVKVKESINTAGFSGGISISAGAPSLHKIFTGVVKGAKMSPCWDDPSYVILTLTGDDVLSLLKGKKYTRRCRGTKASFCIITDVARSGLKSGKFAYTNENVFEIESGETNMNLPAHGTNVDVAAIKGVGEVEASAKVATTILPEVTLVTSEEGE